MTQIPSYLDLPVGPTPTPRMISEATPEKEDLGTPSFMDVFEDVTIASRIVDYFYRPSKRDPNFKISPNFLEKYGRNLPANLVEKLADSESEEEFLYRYRTIRDRLKTQQKLADMGLTGMAYQFGVAMLDPAFLVAAPVAGLAIGSKAVATGVTATRTVRAQAALRGLGISAAVDVPLEGVRLVMDPLTDGEDFVINTLASMGLGTGLSAAFPTMAGFKSGWKKQVELERMRIAADVEKANLDEMLAAITPENAANIKETAQRRGLDTEGKETGEIVRELMALEARIGPGTMGPFLSEEGTTRYINGLSKKDLFAEAKARGIETSRLVTPSAGKFKYQPAVVDVNKKIYYHGTGTLNLSKETIDPFMTRIDGLFGSGLYLTDDIDVAKGYAKSRGKKSGTPTVYELNLNTQKLLDLEQPLSSDEGRLFIDALHENEFSVTKSLDMEDFEDTLNSLRKNKDATISDAYRAFTSEVPSDVLMDEVGDAVGDMIEKLRGLGYEGYTHIGGKIVGKKKHNVLILFDPSDQVMRSRRNPINTMEYTGGNFKTPKKVPRSVKELREELIAARRDDFEIDNQSVAAMITAINESSDELKDQLKLMRFSVEDYAKELSKEIPKESIYSKFINSGPKLKPLAVMARRSENERVRDFFSILVEDPTGSPRIDIETVVYANRQTAMGNYQKARLAIERRNGRKALKDFDANVAEAVRTGKKLDGLEGKAVQAVREFFGGLATFAEESGIAGFRNFVDNNYVPRRAVARKVNEAIEKFGEVEVRRLLTNALRANNPDMADKKVSAVVNGWFKYSQDPNGYVNARVTGKNSQQKLDAMRRVLNRSKITKDEVEEILDFFIPKSNDPHLGMTNKRINFNEATAIEVAGKGVLKFSDLLDNDMTLLMEQYATRVLGSAELTKMAKALDIDVQGTGATVPTRQDMIAWMEKGEGGLSDEMKAGFEVAYNAIMGLSQGNLSDKSRRALRFLQDYAFIQSMGNVGVAQLPELANSTISNGLRATLQSVPRLRKLVRQAANGQLSDEVLEEIDSFVRAGDMLDEGFTRSYRVHEDVGFEESGLGDVGSGIRRTGKAFMKGARTVASGAPVSVAGRGLTLNPFGIGPMDELLRNGHVMATLQNWVNMAYRVKDGKRVTNNFWSKSRKRFEYLGFTDEETDTILEALADPNVTPITKGLLGKNIVKLNLSAMDDGLRNKLVFALRRDLDRVIQRNKIGNLSPWMSHPMANVFLQFRKFAINATNKQLVYNLQMMDGKAGATFLSTALLGTLGYIITTEIGATKFSGKELREYKEEAYGSKEFIGIEVPKLMIAGVIRSGMSGIIPAVASPISQIIDPEEEDIFNTYRTSGYGVNLFSFDNTPGGALITGGYRSSKELIAATLNAVSGGRVGNELTEPELRAILRLIPMRNTIFINELSKALIEQANLPERQK